MAVKVQFNYDFNLAKTKTYFSKEGKSYRETQAQGEREKEREREQERSPVTVLTTKAAGGPSTAASWLKSSPWTC